MYILGIWDGHDAGAALIDGSKIIFASNEERYTNRKLEVGFPYNSIKAAIRHAGIKPSDIDYVAFSTTDLSKTIERLIPSLKESYYLFRRRKIPKPHLERLRRMIKYTITLYGRNAILDQINKSIIAKYLKKIGIDKAEIIPVEHHIAHAAGAVFTNNKREQLVITLDGLGDGLSGSISVFRDSELTRIKSFPSRDSLGILYEQVTSILGMRELEDEGKVMAMADYSYPFKLEENKLRDLIKLDHGDIKARLHPAKQYLHIDSIAWQTPREQLAYMAQQLLEASIVRLVKYYIDETGISDIAMAGGVFSNVKANMKLRELDDVESWYVFPHMGDGGIALGAALYVAYQKLGKTYYKMSPYLGDSYDYNYIEDILKSNNKISYEYEGDEAAHHAAELLSENMYVLWYNGRMEYGPRALGDRSILARSDDDTVKDNLNLYVKKREWFQPFAPSILTEDIDKLLIYDDKGKPLYMTMAYRANEENIDMLKSVVHVDNTARPQEVVKSVNPVYYELISRFKKLSGYGVILNTSFNLHGYPIVNRPEEAIDTLLKTRSKYLFIDGFFIEAVK
ncbi:MAG: carbamoyltransferase [Candidatus Micrarchaeota archaeon]|nr:MAG: carbamoyltransferase [Candidatus Micrarchaeota archaeon]